MNDTVYNLFLKFKAENNDKISFITFWKLKPYWVRKPTEKERETCLCKTCQNIALLGESLKKAKVIDTLNIETLLKEAVCSTGNIECMYGDCLDCKHLTPELKIQNKNEILTFEQWRHKKVTKTFKGGEEKEVNIVIKEIQSCSIESALQKFYSLLKPSYSRHLFNMRNQFKHYKSLRENLTETECMVHIDFSENFAAKMSKEIQSMHFGASLPQISLHTGYYVTGDMDNVRSFCGISDSLRHVPSSVWAYLLPVLQEIKESHPSVEFLHFYSDGPTSQYKQKINFYLLSTLVFELGFRGASWNFHESGHGKGIPDGIGGSIKRSADRKVNYGIDILNAAAFVKTLKDETVIKLYEIKESDILEVDRNIPPLKTVPRTMKIHQLYTESKGKISYRDISCIDIRCSDHPCEHFEFPTYENTRKPKEATEKTQQNYENNNVKHSYKREIEKQKGKKGISREVNSDFLQRLNNCDTFGQLQIVCSQYSTENVTGKERYIQDDGFIIDDKAFDLYPDDVPTRKDLNPVQVRADGNCLPACGSVFVFGTDTYADEIRAHIIKELALHKELYLSKEYLSKSLRKKDKNILKSYAMYSDEYVPGSVLTDGIIEDIFEQEVMSIRDSQTFMGIWQLFALASILKRPIMSVYPKKGNPNVRNDLHRRIEPREKESNDEVYIMWTSNRDDMQEANWVPNHFVPILEMSRHDVIVVTNDSLDNDDHHESENKDDNNQDDETTHQTTI